jgi:hypothetical protein
LTCGDCDGKLDRYSNYCDEDLDADGVNICETCDRDRRGKMTDIFEWRQVVFAELKYETNRRNWERITKMLLAMKKKDYFTII